MHFFWGRGCCTFSLCTSPFKSFSASCVSNTVSWEFMRISETVSRTGPSTLLLFFRGWREEAGFQCPFFGWFGSRAPREQPHTCESALLGEITSSIIILFYVSFLLPLFLQIPLISKFAWEKKDFSLLLFGEVFFPFFFFFFFFSFVFCLFRATPTAYGVSQARGLIRATAAGLHQSHSNARSLTHGVRPGVEPKTSWFLVWFVSAAPRQELLCWVLNQLGPQWELPQYSYFFYKK